jgi:hypothetical protein
MARSATTPPLVLATIFLPSRTTDMAALGAGVGHLERPGLVSPSAQMKRPPEGGPGVVYCHQKREPRGANGPRGP